jgi:hypothetical protein
VGSIRLKTTSLSPHKAGFQGCSEMPAGSSSHSANSPRSRNRS